MSLCVSALFTRRIKALCGGRVATGSISHHDTFCPAIPALSVTLSAIVPVCMYESICFLLSVKSSVPKLEKYVFYV